MKVVTPEQRNFWKRYFWKDAEDATVLVDGETATETDPPA
jgi:hypothetical protein